MKFAWSWLADWTELPESPEALAAILAMRGFPVQSIERGAAFDPGIVVGAVLELAPHPNADRLRLCTVDVGQATLSIVCGAMNVAAGQRVAVAQIGSRLPDGTKLRRSKIRGVESEGMICSERELGLSQESEGIWALPGEPQVGSPVASLAGSAETVLDVEITSNRTDCMSVRGMAREIASSCGGALRARPALRANGKGALPRVAVESGADCPRYMARVVRDLRIGPSPDWMRRRLEAGGMRSINNVVDATNYVLREYGQPIHAFDAGAVGGNAIVVRRARAGERLRLLDGREMALEPSHLVIADEARPMALAGIVGGIESGVSDRTTEVVLECAQFDPVLTRETARALSIESDAAERFSQGVDPTALGEALDATARLLAETAGGAVVERLVDEWPGRKPPRVLGLSLARLSGLLGIEVPAVEASRALGSLEIEQAGAWKREGTDSAASFVVPPHRHDLEIEEDLIEEVARVVGYDTIPARFRPSVSDIPKAPLEETLARRIADIACGIGFDECLSTVLVGEIPAEARDGIEESEVWTLQNPMSRELKHLRVGLLPGLLRTAGLNLRHGTRDVRLGEVGKVFRAQPPPLGAERYEVGLLLAGMPDEWSGIGGPDRYLELKGAVESILEALGIDSVRTEPYHERCWKRGTGARFVASDAVLGRMGQSAPELGSSVGLDRPAWAALLDLGSLAAVVPQTRRYAPIQRFPVSKRDLAIVVSQPVTHADVVGAIREAGGPLLTEARLFDVYEGSALGSGRKSMAYALEFRSPERTLEDREVDAALDKIVRALQSQFGAALRGAQGPDGR